MVIIKQTVVVNTYKQTARITLIEEQKGRIIRRLSFPAFIGEQGASAQIHEGSRRTPKGNFAVGRAFGYPTPPVTALPILPIDPDTYWVDDVSSRFYNRVYRTGDRTSLPFSSAEHLCEYPGYAAGFVIEYNLRPIVPGLGSAIFFHVGETPTKGCIAASKEDTQRLLYWLNPNAHPHILIQ